MKRGQGRAELEVLNQHSFSASAHLADMQKRRPRTNYVERNVWISSQKRKGIEHFKSD